MSTFCKSIRFIYYLYRENENEKFSFEIIATEKTVCSYVYFQRFPRIKY